MKTLFLTTTLSTFLLAGCLSTGQKLGNSALDGDFKKIQKLTSSELINLPANSNGATAITLAAQEGHYDIVKYLLENGANPDIEKNATERCAALCMAVQGGHYEVVKLLTSDSKANINSKNSKNGTPLSLAVIIGNGRIFDLLLDAGADPEVRGSSNRSILHYTLQYGRTDMFNALLAKGVTLDVFDANGDTPVNYAIIKGQDDMLIALIEAGADIMTPHSLNKTTPLYEAATRQNTKAVKVLLDNGVTVNAVMPNGQTALEVVARGRNFEMTKLLLDSGADIGGLNEQTGFSKILEYAYPTASEDFSENHQRMIELLVERGADFKATNTQGQSIDDHYKVARAEQLTRMAEQARIDEVRRIEEARIQEAQRRQAAAQQEKKGSWLGKGIALAAGAGVLGYAGSKGLPMDQIARIGGAMASDIISDSGGTAISALTNEMKAEQAASIKSYTPSSGSSFASGPVKPNLLAAHSSRCASDPQVSALCQGANAYYDNYVRVANAGNVDPSQLYEAHRMSAMNALNYLQNNQSQTGIDLNAPPPSAPSSSTPAFTAQRLAKSNCKAESGTACVTIE